MPWPPDPDDPPHSGGDGPRGPQGPGRSHGARGPMGPQGPDGPQGPQGPQASHPPLIPRRSPLALTGLILAILAMIVSALSQVWTEVMWFDSVSFPSVFTTKLGVQLLLGVLGGGVTALLVWSSLWLGHRLRPIYAPSTPQQDALDRYRAALEPIRKLGTLVLPVVVGVATGLGAAQQWEPYLLWRNQQPFGTTDPHFGLDVGFFVFALPWWTFLVTFLSMAVILAAIAAAFTHYVYGGLQFANRGRGTTRSALIHVSALLAGVVLLRAAGYLSLIHISEPTRPY